MSPWQKEMALYLAACSRKAKRPNDALQIVFSLRIIGAMPKHVKLGVKMIQFVLPSKFEAAGSPAGIHEE